MENRRLFLKRLGQAAVLAATGRCLGGTAGSVASSPTATLPALTTIPSGGPIPESAKSIVIDDRNPMILAGSKIHETVLLEMIETAVRLATGQDSAANAWRALLKPQDVIGIKFDEMGYEKLNITNVFAEQLVGALERAGHKRERIVLIDVPESLARSLKTQPRAWGWQKDETAFAGGSERLARVLEQVTALINVPFLKTDNLSGIAGALRNISLPFIRRQSRYFANGCSPSIADIAALPPIRSKLRVHIVNGLRALFDRGPEVHNEHVWPHAGILASTDPVAVDSVSLDIINTKRTSAGLPGIGDSKGRLPHIHTAAQRGLGTDDQDYIRILSPHNS
ncbi:MAG TPA: DUF362 domain-containing protein [Phycisphaerae bacterium]|nr:DUF362 domain-containing protein [Phycisphaerae bacterium]